MAKHSNKLIIADKFYFSVWTLVLIIGLLGLGITILTFFNILDVSSGTLLLSANIGLLGLVFGSFNILNYCTFN